MINIIVDQVCEMQKFEVDGISTNMPGQPQALMDFADRLAAQHGTLVISGSAAEDVVLRILRRVREGVYKPDEVNICVRHRYCDGEEFTSAMHVTGDGDFVKGWPGGFFEHRLDELF